MFRSLLSDFLFLWTSGWTVFNTFLWRYRFAIQSASVGSILKNSGLYAGGTSIKLLPGIWIVIGWRAIGRSGYRLSPVQSVRPALTQS